MVLHALCARAEAASLVVRAGFVAPLCVAATSSEGRADDDAHKLRGWALAALAALAHSTASGTAASVRPKLAEACLPTLIGALQRSTPDDCRAWAADAVAGLVRADSAATATAVRLGLTPLLANVLSAAVTGGSGGSSGQSVETSHAAARAALAALCEVVQLQVGRSRVLHGAHPDPARAAEDAGRLEPAGQPAAHIVDAAVALLQAPGLARAAATFLRALCASGGLPAARASLVAPALPAALPLLLAASSDDDAADDLESSLDDGYEPYSSRAAPSKGSRTPAAPVRAVVVALTAQLLSSNSVASAYAAAATADGGRGPNPARKRDAPPPASLPAALRALRTTARDVHARASASRRPPHRAAAALLETLLAAIDLELTRALGNGDIWSAPPAARSASTPAARYPQPAHGSDFCEPIYAAPAAYVPAPAPPQPYAAAPQPAASRPPAPSVPTPAMLRTSAPSTASAPTAALASAALRRADSCEQRAAIEISLLSRALFGCEERAAKAAAGALVSTERAQESDSRCDALGRAARDAERRVSTLETELAASQAGEERAMEAAEAAERRAAAAEVATAAAVAAAVAEAEKRLSASAAETMGRAVSAAQDAAAHATTMAVDTATAAAQEAAAAATSKAVDAAVDAAVSEVRAAAAAAQEAALAEAQRVHSSALAAALEHTRTKQTERLDLAATEVKAAEENATSAHIIAEKAEAARAEMEARSYAQVREARKAAEAACRSAADAHARARASECAREEAATEHSRLLGYLDEELKATRSLLAALEERALEEEDAAARRQSMAIRSSSPLLMKPPSDAQAGSTVAAARLSFSAAVARSYLLVRGNATARYR